MTNLFLRIQSLVLGIVLLLAAQVQAEEIRLNFLHFNDTYELTARGGRGGLAALATLVKAERARTPGTILTFGGDMLSPSVASSLTKGAHMIELVNQLGVQAAVLGNHELDFGLQVLNQRLSESNFPWLISNLADSERPRLPATQPQILLERGGVRVGLFGLLTRDSAELSAGGRDIRFLPEIESARAAVSALREKGADLIVALTHLDLAQDRRLLSEVPQIDLILGAHDHEAIACEEGGRLIIKAGQDALYLARVELILERSPAGDGENSWRVRPISWSFFSTLGVAQDPEMLRLAADYNQHFNAVFDQPIATLEQPLDSRDAMVRSGETAIGNLFADALRAGLGADVALLNGGGLRGDRQYEIGSHLTRADVMRELPFGNTAVLIEVSGASLKEALEQGLSKYPAKAGRFPQVAGFSFAFDPQAPVGQRVRDLMLGDKPLEPEARYRLATSDYLADGGDSYGSLRQGRYLVDRVSAPLVATLVMDYIQKSGKVAASIEGRIRPLGAEDGSVTAK